jgi:hypothetical protein
MRKLSLCMLFLVVTLPLFSQQTTSPDSLTKQDYLQRSKSQKTTAFIFLGLGTTLIAIAAPGTIPFDTLPVLAGGVAISIISSTTLFLAAGRNKRKARQLAALLELKQNSLKTYLGTTARSYPALSITVSL